MVHFSFMLPDWQTVGFMLLISKRLYVSDLQTILPDSMIHQPGIRLLLPGTESS